MVKMFFLFILFCDFNQGQFLITPQNNKQVEEILNFLFLEFIEIHKKDYQNIQEFYFRFNVFQNNIKDMIHDLNLIPQNYRIINRQKNGTLKKSIIILDNDPCIIKMSLNQFTDITDDEFHASHLLPSSFFENFQEPLNDIEVDYLKDLNYSDNLQRLEKNKQQLTKRNILLDLLNSKGINESIPSWRTSLLQQSPYQDINDYDQMIESMKKILLNYQSKKEQFFNEDEEDLITEECKIKKQDEFFQKINPIIQLVQGRRLQEGKSKENLIEKVNELIIYQAKQKNLELQETLNKSLDQIENIQLLKEKLEEIQEQKKQLQQDIQNVLKKIIDKRSIISIQEMNQKNYLNEQNRLKDQFKNFIQNKQSFNMKTFKILWMNNQKNLKNTNNIVDSTNNVLKTLNDELNVIKDKISSLNNLIIDIEAGNYKIENKNSKEEKNNQSELTKLELLEQQLKSETNIKSQSNNEEEKEVDEIKHTLQQLSQEQLQQLQSILTKKVKKKEKKNYIVMKNIKIPTKLNWKEKAKFTPIKDQGRCNACYAFSALAALETQYTIKTGEQKTFSEQEILDCSKQNNECVGGQAFIVYDYIKQHGINLDTIYPYQQKRQNCRKKQSDRLQKIKGQLRVEQALNIGPMSVVQHASKDFKFYTSGIFMGDGCEFGWVPNHSAMAYGYNLEAEEPYILFKNGWGDAWGDFGYYKMKIGQLKPNNYGICLIANTVYNSIPLIQLMCIYLQKIILFFKKIVLKEK